MINVQPKTTQDNLGKDIIFFIQSLPPHGPSETNKVQQIKCLNSTPFSSNNTDECITKITKNEA